MVCTIKISNFTIFQTGESTYSASWNESPLLIKKIYEFSINGTIITSFTILTQSRDGFITATFTFNKSLINKCIKLEIFQFVPGIPSPIKGKKLGCKIQRQCTEPVFCCSIIPQTLPWTYSSIEFEMSGNNVCESTNEPPFTIFKQPTSGNVTFSWNIVPSALSMGCDISQYTCTLVLIEDLTLPLTNITKSGLTIIEINDIYTVSVNINSNEFVTDKTYIIQIILVNKNNNLCALQYFPIGISSVVPAFNVVADCN